MPKLSNIITLLLSLYCLELPAQDTLTNSRDTLPIYEEYLTRQLALLPISKMDDSIYRILKPFGGRTVDPSNVRWSIDNRLDKSEKIGKYCVLTRFDSTGQLLVKKYTKPWYVSKSKGQLLPFQVFPVNNIFWFMYYWEENEFVRGKKRNGYIEPPLAPYVIPRDCFFIQDSTSQYYFLFTDYTSQNICRDGAAMYCYKLSCYSSIFVLDSKLNPVVYITQALNCTDAHVVTIQKNGLYDARLGLTWAEIKANTLKDLAILIRKVPKKPLPNSKVHDNDVYRMEFNSWGLRIRNDFDWKNYRKKTCKKDY